MKYFTATTLIFYAVLRVASTLYAFENQSFLQIGTGIGFTSFQSRENESGYESFNFGINTQFGYRYHSFELGLFSNIYFGRTEDIKVVDNVDFVSGDGWVNGIDIGAYCKYFLPLSPVEGWRVYGFLGPALSLRTLRFSDFDTNTSLDTDYKITLNSQGIQLRIGVEQKDKQKEAQPIYFELIYSYMSTYKGAVVDISDVTRQETIETKNLDDLGFHTHSFLVSIGFSLL